MMNQLKLVILTTFACFIAPLLGQDTGSGYEFPVTSSGPATLQVDSMHYDKAFLSWNIPTSFGTPDSIWIRYTTDYDTIELNIQPHLTSVALDRIHVFGDGELFDISLKNSTNSTINDTIQIDIYGGVIIVEEIIGYKPVNNEHVIHGNCLKGTNHKFLFPNACILANSDIVCDLSDGYLSSFNGNYTTVQPRHYFRHILNSLKGMIGQSGVTQDCSQSELRSGKKRNEGENNHVLKVWPSPATDRLNIEGNNLTEGSKVQILDLLTGRVLLTEEILEENNIKLKVSTLANGVYILRISGNNEKPISQKVVIQH